MPSLIKNLLLDRDGTLIQDRHYLNDPAEVRLLPGVAPALQALQKSGISFYLVSNQSGLGRGYFSFRMHQAVQAELRSQLANQGIFLQAELICPHSPAAGCGCRKPETLLWETLRCKFGLLPEQSAMLGDKPSDLAFGLKAGLRLSLLLGDPQRLPEVLKNLHPELQAMGEKAAVVPNLPAASRLILGQNKV
ncbi:MAG: HAD-IIIA family hydrolase [Desulfohalobiaceae bacterium]